MDSEQYIDKKIRFVWDTLNRRKKRGNAQPNRKRAGRKEEDASEREFRKWDQRMARSDARFEKWLASMYKLVARIEALGKSDRGARGAGG